MSLSATTAVPGPSAPTQTADATSGAIVRMRRGASWFFTIAILSGINSLLQIFDAHIRFIFGLGITQVVGSMA